MSERDPAPLGLLRARSDFIDYARPSIALCRRLGLDWAEVEAHAGGLFMAPVHLQGSWFNFDPEGIEAAIIEVRDADSWTVLDLLGWVPTVPDRWFFAVGGAPALGMSCAAKPSTHAAGLPLQLHRTPEQWLREQCFGAVLLDLNAGMEWLTGLALADTVAVRDDPRRMPCPPRRRRPPLG